MGIVQLISRFLPGRNTVKGVALLLFMLWVVYGFNRKPYNHPIWTQTDYDKWRQGWSDNERKYYSLRGDELSRVMDKYRKYLHGTSQMRQSTPTFH